MTSTDTLAQLEEMGVAIWLDDISRERLTTGNLASLARDMHVSGVTSNPTIFAKAMSAGNAYADQIADLALRGVSIDEAARALWWQVDRPNLFIKIPATEPGLPAITQCLSEGISINVTLIFSLERHGQVIDAFFEGLEKASGRDISTIASVASFFVSRVDTEVDGRLDKIGTPEAHALRGKAALANARLAYELFEQKFATPRWQALKARGAKVQRPLWASTSVKDPAFADTMYVVELAAPDTVNTMPEATMHATQEHGKLHGDAIRGTYDDSRRVFEQLEALGVSYDDVVQVLEKEGVEKFAASWQEMADTIKDEMAAGGSTT